MKSKALRATTLVAVFLITLLLSIGIGAITTSPKNNLVWLADFKPTPTNASYQSISGWVGYYRYGYILVLSTKNNKTFEDADYVIVRRLRENFTVDILTRPGETILLTGQAARDYITKHLIDTAAFDRNWTSFRSQ